MYIHKLNERGKYINFIFQDIMAVWNMSFQVPFILITTLDDGKNILEFVQLIDCCNTLKRKSAACV